MPANKHKVPVRQWRKWNDVERALFNDLFGATLRNKAVMSHPQMAGVSQAMWRTLCWNFAWLAADALREQRKAGSFGMIKGNKYIELDKRGNAVRELTVH